MQIRQRIFNCIDMQIMHFILDKILKRLTYYTLFLSLVVAKLWYEKNSPFFLAHHVIESRIQAFDSMVPISVTLNARNALP